MIAVWAVLIASPFAVTGAVVAVAARYPRRFMVGRSAQSKSPLLYARLVPSPRELPGRPSAAASEGRVYRITDARGKGNG